MATKQETIVRDGRTWIEIPATAFGDYIGCTVERANNESLLKEFPNEQILYRYWQDGYNLVWNDEKHSCDEIPIEIKYATRIVEVTSGDYSALYGLYGDPDIEEWIAALSDYPVVDEDALIKLEWELDMAYVEEEIVDDILRHYMNEADAYCEKYDCTEDELKDDIREEALKYIDDNNMYFVHEQAYCAYLSDTEDVIKAVVDELFGEE